MAALASGVFTGTSLAFFDEAFTGDLDAIYALTSGKRWIISGWDLTVHANSVVCPIRLELGTRVVAASHMPVHGATAGYPKNTWQLVGVNLTGMINEALNIAGGGTAAVLNGTIWCQQV